MATYRRVKTIRQLRQMANLLKRNVAYCQELLDVGYHDYEEIANGLVLLIALYLKAIEELDKITGKI